MINYLVVIKLLTLLKNLCLAYAGFTVYYFRIKPLNLAKYFFCILGGKFVSFIDKLELFVMIGWKGGLSSGGWIKFYLTLIC